ncbi:MAG: (4Fe-4S)-binding protein [Dehalococcoidia bacterium]|nr:(4Fe-4S)-binding protein [Dehalococcoidia bacterium]
MQRVYSNDKITVFWDSEKCIHSGNCFSTLPDVFKPIRRPWVDIDAADAEVIKKTIDKCPSGALTCRLHK